MRAISTFAKILTASTVALALAGCIPSTHPPERLYPIPYEIDLIRSSQDELARQYNAAFLSSPSQAKLIRNEIIAQRMYAIDVQYTLYENSLTRESQEVGFGALTTAEGLSTAATLVVPAATKTILSAAATGVLAVKGHYDSEVLLAQTMRTIQKQMRASRNLVAASISAKLVKSVAEYPLSSAFSDLEEYYSAGTLTSGVIDTSTTVGNKEDDSKIVKQAVTQAPAGQRAAILQSAMIASPSTPLPGPLPKVPPFKVNAPAQDVSGFQAALCLPQDGKVGPELLKAAGNFISGRDGGGVPKLTVIGERTEAALRDAEDLVPNCKNAGFKSAFEVGAFGVSSGVLGPTDRVKELQKQLGVTQTGTLDGATRAAVAKFRVDKGISPSLGGEVDRQFMKQLFL